MSTPAMRRVMAVGAGVLVLLVGGAVLASGVSDMAVLMRGLGSYRPVIVSDPYAGSAILLGVMALGIGVLFIVLKPADPAQPRPRTRRRNPRQDTAENWVARCLLFILACIVASLFGPLVQRFAVASVASSHGDVRCPDIAWPRHQPDRWAFAGAVGSCPSEGALPNS